MVSPCAIRINGAIRNNDKNRNAMDFNKIRGKIKVMHFKGDSSLMNSFNGLKIAEFSSWLSFFS